MGVSGKVQCVVEGVVHATGLLDTLIYGVGKSVGHTRAICCWLTRFMASPNACPSVLGKESSPVFV